VTHFASSSFWATYQELPSHVGKLADKNFQLLKSDPSHPSLHFKRVGPFWSVRVGRNWRALGQPVGDDIVWFWIGTHQEYDRLIRS